MQSVINILMKIKPNIINVLFRLNKNIRAVKNVNGSEVLLQRQTSFAGSTRDMPKGMGAVGNRLGPVPLPNLT